MGKSSINGNGIFQLYHLIFNHCFMLKFIKKHIKTEKIVYDKSHFPKKKGIPSGKRLQFAYGKWQTEK